MKRDAILDASVAVLTDQGLAGWTLDAVAAEAKCAKGLVLYHHESKAKLLALTAQSIGADLEAERVAGLRLRDPLAGLWIALHRSVVGGRFGALVSLRANGFRGDSTPARLHAAVAAALDIPLEALADETALRALCDGVCFQLLAGTPEPTVRASYDQLWISMVTAE